jgi:hypothetical protein
MVIPFGLASVGPGIMLQEDNAKPHSVRIIQEYHGQNLNYTHLE